MFIKHFFDRATHCAFNFLGANNSIKGKILSHYYRYNDNFRPNKLAEFQIIAEKTNNAVINAEDSWTLKLSITDNNTLYVDGTALREEGYYSASKPLILECDHSISFDDASKIVNLDFEAVDHMLKAILKSENLPDITREILDEILIAVEYDITEGRVVPFSSAQRSVHGATHRSSRGHRL